MMERLTMAIALLGGLALTAPALSAGVSRDALVPASMVLPVQATAGGTVTVQSSAGYAKLRAGTSTSSEVLDKVTQGTKLEVLGKSGGWTQVKFGDKTGYVNNKLVTR